VGLRLPAARGKRDRIASVEESSALLSALPEEARALWATAFYAGLRRGELQALRWRHVDLEQRVIHVEASWDQEAGEIDVKTEAGNRTPPIADVLRRLLVEHRLRTGRRSDDDLVFGRTTRDAFVPSTVRSKSRAAWAAAGLEPIGLHEARHCAASFFIASGMEAKRLSVYMGHSDIRVTYNVYGHLMPGSLDQDADRLSTFLDERVDELRVQNLGGSDRSH